MCEFQKKFYSTKEAAVILETSESSVKRWVDNGDLVAIKTAGGHRKIDHASLFDFIQKKQTPTNSKKLFGKMNVKQLQKKCYDSLREGDLVALSELAMFISLQSKSISYLVDQVIYPAYLQLRSECIHPSEECMVLHRGIDHIIKSLDLCLPKLRQKASSKKKTILCADIGYDVDGLPAHFADYIASGHINSIQLGLKVPSEVLLGAISSVKPDFIWISACGKSKVGGISKTVTKLQELASELNVPVIKYGEQLSQKLKNAITFESFKDFENYIVESKAV